MIAPIEITSQGLARTQTVMWRQHGETHATIVAEVGFRIDEHGRLVADGSAYAAAETGTPRLSAPEVIVTGANVGWLRVWRGQEVILDKSGQLGLGVLPEFAPQRAEKLQGRAAPGGQLHELHAAFDFAYYQAAAADQWLDRLQAGDVFGVYGPDVQAPVFVVKVPDEVVTANDPKVRFRCDRLSIDVDRRQCTFSWRGEVIAGPASTWKLHLSYGPAQAGAAEDLSGTMGVSAAGGGGALPFAQIARAMPRGEAQAGSFAQLRQQAPTVDPAAVDATMGIGPAAAPPATAPAPPAPAPAPPAPFAYNPNVAAPPPVAPASSPASAEPVAEPELMAAAGPLPEKLDEVDAPEIAEEVAIKLTALPTPEQKAAIAPIPPGGGPPGAAPGGAAPAPPAAAGSQPGKKKRKDVRTALLKKMRKK